MGIKIAPAHPGAQVAGGLLHIRHRIKDIRSSEKVLYRQVLDLYATAIDYNPNAPETIRFFKIVQNKFHFAAHGNTAAEVIYNRVDANKPFMGLTSFKGELPSINDIEIAEKLH